MKSAVILCFIGLCVSLANGQTAWNFRPDTLSFNYRSSGSTDTMDLVAFAPTLLPGPGFYHPYGFLSAGFFIDRPSGNALTQYAATNRLAFTALPHLGFYYSFGSKGYQHLQTEYHQTLKDSSLLYFRVNRNSSNGLIRNSAFTHSTFDGQYLKSSGRYWVSTSFQYGNDDRALNGGVVDTSGYLSFGPDFATVRFNNAKSTTQSFYSRYRGAIALGLDSARWRTGPIHTHSFNLNHRIFSETDTLAGLYPVINIDTNTTRDQMQENNWANGLGWMISNKNFEWNAALQHRYRRLQNLGAFRDTQEVEFYTTGQIYLNNLSTSWHYRQNIVGARGETELNAAVTYTQSNFKTNFSAHYSNLLPNFWQREYFANGLSYSSALTLQQRLNFQSNSTLEGKNWRIRLNVGYDRRSGILQWSGTEWGEGLGSDWDLLYARLSPEYRIKKIGIYPFIEITSGFDFLPTQNMGMRLALHKKLFKGQKLNVYLLLDGIYAGGYLLSSYDRMMDVYHFQTNSPMQRERFLAHLTTGLEIDEFRFFLRAENLHTFFEEEVNAVANGFFATPFVIRLGVTWEFFN